VGAATAHVQHMHGWGTCTCICKGGAAQLGAPAEHLAAGGQRLFE
jgi:hypothetical protein